MSGNRVFDDLNHVADASTSTKKVESILTKKRRQRSLKSSRGCKRCVMFIGKSITCWREHLEACMASNYLRCVEIWVWCQAKRVPPRARAWDTSKSPQQSRTPTSYTVFQSTANSTPPSAYPHPLHFFL